MKFMGIKRVIKQERKTEQLPCFGLKMGNGSPNFQKKYMKVNHTMQANRSFCLCTKTTERALGLIIFNTGFIFMNKNHVILAILTKAYVADNKVSDVERHHEYEHK